MTKHTEWNQQPNNEFLSEWCHKFLHQRFRNCTILEEAERCDRLLLLHQGKRVAEGTPSALKARVGGDVVELGVADPKTAGALITDRFGLKPQFLLSAESRCLHGVFRHVAGGRNTLHAQLEVVCVRSILQRCFVVDQPRLEQVP